MRIAVTGGGGFLGGHVATYAQALGHEVVFFDRRNGNDILGDLSALDGADAVIHMAGVLGTSELFDNVEEAIQVNILGSYRIADWCLNNNAQYTGILMPDVFPSVYTATKVAAHRITNALHKAKGLRCSHVIAYNAYGAGQAYGKGHPQKFLPTFSVAAWNNVPIPIWGDGSQLIDPVAAEDVARMMVDAGYGDNALFDAGTGKTVSVLEFANFVLDVTGSKAGIQHFPMRLGETGGEKNVAATGLGWDRLGWQPQFSWKKMRDAIISYRGVQWEEA